jgi:adenylosuccinate synthase
MTYDPKAWSRHFNDNQRLFERDGLVKNIFKPNRVSVVMGAQTGSEAKGCASALLAKIGRPGVLLTANSRNSSHTVTDSSVSRSGVVKVLPAGAFYWGYQDYRPYIFIGPGAAFKPEDLKKEVEMLEVPRTHLFIHPLAAIVTPEDEGLENGTHDFNGKPIADRDLALSRTGTTGSGSGAARAKRALRRATMARDVNAVWEYAQPRGDINETIANCYNGALLDGSQGFQLSNYGPHYPYCTSRSTSVASFLSETCVAPALLNSVVGVNRTFPIRIASNRYLHNGAFLTQVEIDALRADGRGDEIQVVEGSSGGWETDQTELTWDEIRSYAGWDVPSEITTLTKLPRRIATMSEIAWRDFVRLNNAPGGVFMFLTFLNYLNGDPKAAHEHGKSLTKFMADSDVYCGEEHVLFNWSPETDHASTL